MPGPGLSTVGPTGGSAAGSAAVRLREGLDGWRRHISRRRSAAAARHWSLITLGAALAGVAAGRLDGRMLLTTIAVTAGPLCFGAVTVVRRRRVSTEDAARQLDALFGFDEQVATAVCCTNADTSAAGGETDVTAWMVAALIERAATLVAETGGAPDPRPGPAYGEWAAMAVTAAAVAAVAAVPGAHPAAPGTAVGTGGLAGPAGLAVRLHGAVAGLRPAHAGGVIRAAAPAPAPGPRSAPAGGAFPGSAAAGSVRPAASATGAHEAPGYSVPASPAKAGTPVASGTAGAGAASGRTVPAPTGGSGQHGTVGASGASRATGAAGARAGHSPTAQAPTAQAATAQSPVTQGGATRSATAQHATGQRGTAAHGGLRAGDAAGMQPGGNRTSAHPAQLLPGAGATVLLIILPGGDGVLAGPTGKGTPGQQPEGDGGTSAAIQTAMAPGNGAEYVAPDQNEVPFPDLSLLGRYF